MLMVFIGNKIHGLFLTVFNPDFDVHNCYWTMDLIKMYMYMYNMYMYMYMYVSNLIVVWN